MVSSPRARSWLRLRGWVGGKRGRVVYSRRRQWAVAASRVRVTDPSLSLAAARAPAHRPTFRHLGFGPPTIALPWPKIVLLGCLPYLEKKVRFKLTS